MHISAIFLFLLLLSELEENNNSNNKNQREKRKVPWPCSLSAYLEQSTDIQYKLLPFPATRLTCTAASQPYAHIHSFIQAKA